jgi:EAL domain-containing protein (putative c-di-GMP-specific phosphodiesterase class I)
LEQDLRRALDNDEFELHYQPLIDIKSNEICGFEALLRWTHPIRGSISPSVFIPVAEDIGLIIAIGEKVLFEACRTAASWPRKLKVAVNLSAAQFRDRMLVQRVASALKASGLPASRLELEITETVLLEDSKQTLAILHDLRNAGARIAIDDFGTGYSSLSYLASFPFHKIKIDQSFVRNLKAQSDSLSIVELVVGLGNSLGMTTTAEGVETPEQFAELQKAGCTEAQGFLFAPGRPANELEFSLSALRACEERSHGDWRPSALLA